jgi:hypothetical protein
MIGLILAAALVLLASTELHGRPVGASEDSSFCSTLKSMIRAGGDDFRSIHGNPDPDYSEDGGKGWDSNISLPGAESCSVFEYHGATVVCDFKESTSESDLEDDYGRLSRQLSDCLEKWTKTQTGPSEYSKSLIKETSFTQAAITVRVAITDKRSKRHPGYNLKIWIDKKTED